MSCLRFALHRSVRAYFGLLLLVWMLVVLRLRVSCAFCLLVVVFLRGCLALLLFLRGCLALLFVSVCPWQSKMMFLMLPVFAYVCLCCKFAANPHSTHNCLCVPWLGRAWFLALLCIAGLHRALLLCAWPYHVVVCCALLCLACLACFRIRCCVCLCL